MTSDTTPDWDTIAEQEIESRRDAMADDTGDHATVCSLCLPYRPGELPGNYAHRMADELGPRFVRAYHRGRARRSGPGPLCINGREYTRRQANRRKRGR